MSFAAAVAERASQDQATVQSVLDAYGIEPQPTAAAPVSLHVTRVKFAGVKRREGREDQSFEFERELTPGLWAVTSEPNLAGKSSVLLVIRWALTGRSHLTDDVESWISSVELDGTVGDDSFSIRFTNEEGQLSGELRAGDSRVAGFDGSTFEEVMDSFFLDRLRLDPTPFWQTRGGGGETEGDRRRFGWTAYFPALHLPADNPGALLGDQVQGGQPGALMQVFLGLPWALTSASARVAHNQLRMSRAARQRRQSEDTEAREGTLAPLREELETARQTLVALREARAPVSAEEADVRLAAFAQALADQRGAQERLVGAQAAAELTQVDLDEATKRLEAIEQSRVVRPLLGRLAPSICPRCTNAITQERIQREEAAHECSVCAESLDADREDEQERDDAREAVGQASEEHEAAVGQLAEAEAEHRRAREALAAAEAAVRDLEERQPAEAEARELETMIARLEGRLEQPVLVAPAEDEGLDTEYTVVGAARQEAEERRREASTEMLAQLGEQIADLGRAFGIQNLESASPTLGAQLRLRIGDTQSSFSNRTGGERLRLRLATVIALLRVGQEHGVGRHPGLLLIDSPGGEEMVEGDVAAILRELAAVCEQLPDLQLICATARAAEVREVLPSERIIHGPNDAEVW